MIYSELTVSRLNQAGDGREWAVEARASGLRPSPRLFQPSADTYACAYSTTSDTSRWLSARLLSKSLSFSRMLASCDTCRASSTRALDAPSVMDRGRGLELEKLGMVESGDC